MLDVFRITISIAGKLDNVLAVLAQVRGFDVMTEHGANDLGAAAIVADLAALISSLHC